MWIKQQQICTWGPVTWHNIRVKCGMASFDILKLLDNKISGFLEGQEKTVLRLTKHAWVHPAFWYLFLKFFVLFLFLSVSVTFCRWSPRALSLCPGKSFQRPLCVPSQQIQTDSWPCQTWCSDLWPCIDSAWHLSSDWSVAGGMCPDFLPVVTRQPLPIIPFSDSKHWQASHRLAIRPVVWSVACLLTLSDFSRGSESWGLGQRTLGMWGGQKSTVVLQEALTALIS